MGHSERIPLNPGARKPCVIARLALLCAGFACVFATCPFSFFGTSPQLKLGMGWFEIAVARSACLVVAVIGYHGKALEKQWAAAHRTHQRIACNEVFEAMLGASAIIAGFAILCFCPSHNLLARSVIYGAFSGIGMATLYASWFNRLFLVRFQMDRTGCFACFAVSFLLTVIISWLLMLPNPDITGIFIEVSVLICISAGCLVKSTGGSAQEMDNRIRNPVRFELSPYSRAILFGLGISWAQAFNMTVELGYGSGPENPTTWAVTITSCAALLFIGAPLAHRIDIGSFKFGLLMRWFLTCLGCLWALMPILAECLPILANITFCMMFWATLTLFFIFTMEVCLERHLSFIPTLAPFISTFFLGAVSGSIMFALVRMLAGGTWQTHSLVSAIAVMACLLVMPMMPSRASNAHIFTLDALPDEKLQALSKETRRRDFIENYGLTPRETEVFDLLMKGLSRDEMAQELSISPATVKNHTRSILSKTDTHSVRELMAAGYER